VLFLPAETGKRIQALKTIYFKVYIMIGSFFYLAEIKNTVFWPKLHIFQMFWNLHHLKWGLWRWGGSDSTIISPTNMMAISSFSLLSDKDQWNENISSGYAIELFIFFVGIHRNELQGLTDQFALELHYWKMKIVRSLNFHANTPYFLITETRTTQHASSKTWQRILEWNMNEFTNY
jgi:hypothetical protein